MSGSRRVMAVDHGEKRIGVALSDYFGLFAQPHCIITCTKPEADFAKLKAIAQAAEVTRVVVGLPTGTDGGVGMQAQIVIRWARSLADVLQLPIVFWDESYTSMQAESVSHRRKRKGRRHLDDVAAAAILQEYLDAGGEDHEPGQTIEAFSHIP